MKIAVLLFLCNCNGIIKYCSYNSLEIVNIKNEIGKNKISLGIVMNCMTYLYSNSRGVVNASLKNAIAFPNELSILKYIIEEL